MLLSVKRSRRVDETDQVKATLAVIAKYKFYLLLLSYVKRTFIVVVD